MANVAVQLLDDVIVTCPLELQSPLQPVKVELELAVAPAVTAVLPLYVPAPVTIPKPLPALLIVRVNVHGEVAEQLKVAEEPSAVH